MSPLPRCNRCRHKGFDCTFEPVRRRGRPPKHSVERVPSPPPVVPPTLSLRRSPVPKDRVPSHSEPAASPREQSSSPPGISSSLRPDRPGGPSTQLRPAPYPSVASQKRSIPTSPSAQSRSSRNLAGSLAVQGWQHVTLFRSRRIVDPRLVLESICVNYLSEVHTWQPVLSPRLEKLERHLSTCDPLLLASINCVVYPTLDPPLFPPANHRISLAVLQASVFLTCQAFGNGDSSRALKIASWASSQLRALGWRGDDITDLARAIQPQEVAEIVECGWTVHALSILIGVLSGNREKILSIEIELPDELTSKNMLHHAVALFRDATAVDRNESISTEDRIVYEEWLLNRAECVYRAAVDFLDTTTPAFDPAQHLRSEALVLATARVTAFMVAIISCSSSILLLTRNSCPPHLLDPTVSGDLSEPPALCRSDRDAISKAAKKIMTVVKTTRNRQGKLVSLQYQSPFFAPFILVAAFGLLVGSSTVTGREPQANGSIAGADATDGGDLPNSSSSKDQVVFDIEFCELILNDPRQQKWAHTESMKRKLSMMKETASLLQDRALPNSLAVILN